MKGFDFVARFYDLLSFIVFQKDVLNASRRLASWVVPGSKVLILGGGSGELLGYFDKSISVDYVELSEVMIRKAQARESESTNLFYNLDFLDFESEAKYDYILCPFFLDLFIPSQLDTVITRLKSFLHGDGVLLVADFCPDKTTLFNRFLLWVMILFFRFFSGIKITEYNDLFKVLELQGFVKGKEESLRNQFILICKLTLLDRHKC